MAGEIKRLEIFAAGTWAPSNAGKMTVTEANLDEMVSHFQELQGSNVVKPHLKLGHTDAQKWFGQDVGIPTLGWVERVWREGNKLFADIANVPDALLDLIRQKRFHNVSVEVFTPGQVEFNGKKLGHVLSAIAILGTEMPAVKDLAGLAAALFATQFASPVAEKPVTFTSERNETAMFTQEQVDSLIAAAVSRITAELTAKFQEIGAAQVTELAVVRARAESAEAAVAKQATDFAQAQAVATIEAAIKDGKLMPAQKDMAMAFMTSMTGPIKFGGTEKPASVLFSEFIGGLGKQVDLKEKGKTADGAPAEFATAAAEVDAAVQAHMTKVTASGGTADYAVSFAAVKAANPTLMTRYAAGE